MNINFDNYEYHGEWFGIEKVDFNGQQIEVDVQIDGYDDIMIPESGKNALLDFFNNFNNYTAKIEKAVFEYYCKEREELGYSIEVNEDYPALSKSEEILKMITLVGITIPDQDDYDKPAVSLVFDCTWEEEHGLGIRYIGGDIVEVGFQDIAL